MSLYPFGYGPDGGPGHPVTIETIKASHSFQLLHTEMQRRGEAIIIASNGKLGFGQGWRSPEQADSVFVVRHHVVPCSTKGAISFENQCWALSAGFEPSAPAYLSFHCPTPTPLDGENGALAIDFVGDMNWFDANCNAYGLINRISAEIWHGQLAELPHSRSVFNANPMSYPIHQFALPGAHPPTQPPQEEDEMPSQIHVVGDAATYNVDGLIATWTKDEATQAAAVDAKLVTPGVRDVQRAALGILELHGAEPDYTNVDKVAFPTQTSGADFARHEP